MSAVKMGKLYALLIWQLLALGVQGGRKNYEEILSSLEYPEKLVFDVTQPLNDKLRSASPDFIYMKTIESIGIRLSPILYYTPEKCLETIFVHCDQLRELLNWSRVLPVQPKILFRGSLSQHKPLNSTLPLGTASIYDFLNSNGAANDSHFAVIEPIQSYNRALNLPALGENQAGVMKSKFEDTKSRCDCVKIGLDYYGGIIQDHSYPPLVKLADVVIFNFDIPLEQFILSYSSFKSNLRDMLQEKYELVPIANSNCTVYAKLNLVDDPSQQYSDFKWDEQLHQKYYYYLLQFAVYWVNDGESEGIIMEGFNNTLGSKAGLDGVPLKDLLTIEIHSHFNYGACLFKAMVDSFSPNCSSVAIGLEERGKGKGLLRSIQTDKCILSDGPRGCLQMESDVCNRPNSHTSMPDINLEYYLDDPNADSTELFVNFTNLLTDLPWKQIEIYLSTDVSYGKDFLSRIVTQVAELPSEITVACGTLDNASNDNDLINTVLKACDFLWNRSRFILWTINFSNRNDIRDLSRRLVFLEERRQQFLQLFPGKSIKFRVILQSSVELDGVECHPEVVSLNEKAEVVMHFARIHNVHIQISYLGYMQGRRPVRTVSFLIKGKLKFPVFVNRDYPEKFLLQDFHTDPCLTWSNVVPQDGIYLDSEYAGSSLYLTGMKNHSLTSDELETLLIFAFHKFSLIELVPETVVDLETILHGLSQQNLVKKLEAEESKPAQIYLRIDPSLFYTGKIHSKDVLDKLEKMSLGLTGLHFVNWNTSIEIDDSFLKILKSHNFTVGIFIEDCVAEVNDYFGSLKKFQQLSQMDYLVCNFQYPKEASNIDRREMAKYLDTTLYIQRYFQRMFPNETKELLFRLNTIPSTTEPTVLNVQMEGKIERMVRNKVSDFLIFFSDVGRYAKDNKMKFFMFPTFDDMAGTRFGWWGLSDFQSLTNTSAYVEKEADYLKQETWRPTPPPSKTVQPNLLKLILFGIGTFLFLLISTILLLRFWYRRHFALLTKKEVDMFLYGKLDDGSGGSTFDSRKFPKEFEISRNRFVLCNIIGKGNFGLVYNAMLTDADGQGSSSVAVKMPHPDCSKASFQSMLFELKVLCYVGGHPNVLQFIGAYIKEIGRGMTYIATELCEKGALQEYLRQLSDQISELDEEKEGVEPVQFSLDRYELLRFGHEIALGMEYIASKTVIHGDLSTRNVLLDSNLQCKIGDFGLSRKLYEYQEYVKNKHGGLELPWRWLAIESLKELKFTTKSDVWSYGVTLWEIFNLGSVPYPGLAWTPGFLEELENGMRMSAPTYSTDAIFDIMSQCWNANPSTRPTFTEISQFFCNARDKEYIQVISC